MITNLSVTNNSGDKFTFNHSNRLTKGLDLSGLRASVNRLETTSPGSKYQKTRLEERDFDIEFRMMRHSSPEIVMDNKRGNLYRVFNPNRNPMRLDFKLSDGKDYYLMAELTSSPIMPPDKSNNNAVWQNALLQFIATDPFIYEANHQSVDVATWIGAFEFPLEIPEEGIEMGYRSESLIANVFNGGQESTGMLIRFKALGTVVNPSLVNVNTYEEFKLNFTMQGGDMIEVSTYQGRKTITLIRNNVRSNIFYARKLLSKFLQLDVGDNLFRYDAESGLESLEIQMNFTPRLLGV
ncbi:phage tail family protein [Sporosarcina sp. FSL K6-1522]|uniref:phage tail family protein n=1 Tax=Sporosarcina sp. FSL K6-1522 TaxID=2921554 RepID=UPI00315A5987